MKIQLETNFQIANELKREGKWDESIAFYQLAIEENPNFHWSHHGLAEALTKIGRFEDAIISYKTALKINPNFSSSYYNLGDIWAKMGHWHQAIPAYCRAIELNPKYYGSYKKLGDCLYQVTMELGGELSASFLEKHKQISDTLFASEGTKYGLDSYSMSDDVFLRSTNSLNDENFIEEVYRTYLKRQADEVGKIEYINHLRQGMTRENIIHTFKNSPEFNQKSILSIKQDYLRESVINYRLAIELNPNSAKSYEDLAKALNQLGKVMTQQGELEQARELYQQAIKVDPNLIESYYDQGNILVKQNKINEAIESYQQAIAIQPNSLEAYITLGDILFQQGKLEDAIHNYEKAISLKPDWVNPYILCGHAFRYLEKLEDAQKSYAQAITLNPNSPWSYFHLGVVLDEMNLEQEAKACWEKMIALNPNFIGAYFAIAYHYYFKGDQDEWEKWMKTTYELQADLARLHQFDQLGIRFLYDGWAHAIGHTALLDIYLKLGTLGWRKPQHTILLVGSQNVANPCYLNYWKSYIEIVLDPASIDGFPDKVNFLKDLPIALINLPDGRTLRYGEAGALVQKQWEEEHRAPLLAISPEDHEKGWKFLRLLGVPKDAWFVTLHVRTDGFHKEQAPHLSQIRSANINTYLEAIELIVAQGGWVIRMGDSTMEPLPPMKQVIDYAHSKKKADYIDVFLCANCRFFIGTASGLSFVPPTFGVPCVLTNWAPMGLTSFYSQDIFIPKLYWSEAEQRYLSFSEFMSTPISSIYYTKKLLNLGIQIVDNTPNEIKSAVLEMLERCNGQIQYSEEDQLLQQKFKRLSQACKSYGNNRIGRDFIRHYAHLLMDNNQIIQQRLAVLETPTEKAQYNWENWYVLGSKLEAQGETERAISCYQQVISLNPEYQVAYEKLTQLQPSNWENWYVLGEKLESQGETERAVSCYQQVISLNPDYLGGYEKLTQLQPSNWENWLNLANLYRLVEAYNKAVEIYSQVIKINPQLAEGYYYLGKTLTAQGKLVEAIDIYQKAFELNPSYAETDNQLIDISNRLVFNGGEIASGYKPEDIPVVACKALEFKTKLAQARQLTKLSVNILKPEWTVAIGHIACLDKIIKMGILGWRSPHIIYLNTSQNVANPCYFSYWHSFLSMIDSSEGIKAFSTLAEYLQESVAYWNCRGEWMYHLQAGGLVQKQWEIENRSPLLTLSASDYERGWECLHKLGVPKDSWFVSLHVREEVAGDSYAPIRRSDINTYSLAIKSIVNRGGWVIRLGDRGMPPLRPTDGVIDYAYSEFKSDWMDVFLCSSCRFLIGMSSGPSHVAGTFGIPCVGTNWANLWFHLWDGNSIFIPKLYWLEREKRYLTFSEVLEKLSCLEYMVHQKQYLDSIGISIVDNTPDEINDVVREMLEKLDGKANYTVEDESRQAQFNQVLETHKSYGNAKGGKDFLKKYAQLLF